MKCRVCGCEYFDGAKCVNCGARDSSRAFSDGLAEVVKKLSS